MDTIFEAVKKAMQFRVATQAARLGKKLQCGARFAGFVEAAREPREGLGATPRRKAKLQCVLIVGDRRILARIVIVKESELEMSDSTRAGCSCVRNSRFEL